MTVQSANLLTSLRQEAVTLFREGVAAANPEQAVAAALVQRSEMIEQTSRIVLVAFGKAACAMARAAMPFVRDKLVTAIALTNHENVERVDGVEVIAGGHPIPDKGSVAGAAAIERAVLCAHDGDLVLVLVSGGGSALLCAPPLGIELDDKIALNEALIRSGADISEINAVRPIFSRLKGGQMASLAGKAQVLSLILSDVCGDDIAMIASGPTARPRNRARRAREVLNQYGLLQKLSTALKCRLEQMSAMPDVMETDFDNVENIVIGSNVISLRTVVSKAKAKFDAVVHASDWLGGDVLDAAAELHRIALRAAELNGHVAVVCGGETTVKVKGSGKGGRNQELALRFALLNELQPIDRPWVFLSGGTDGIDGPTNAAGGIVDAGSPHRIRQAGHDPIASLENNDAYHALACSGDLLITGATGANVADIQIMLMRQVAGTKV
jgi:hydroxypyruvate reductase